MLRMWSGGSWACATLRVNCAVLLLLAQYTAQKAKAEPPATYTWKIERMQLGGNGAHIQIFREGDLIVAYQDVPVFLFPCAVRSVQVACTVPPGQYHYPLRVLVGIYDANGDIRFVSNKEAAILLWDSTRFRLTICTISRGTSTVLSCSITPTGSAPRAMDSLWGC